MSLFEPQIDPEPDDVSQLPVLDVPLRGRKGQQVTAYIEEMATRLDHQRVRAEQAEQATAHLRHQLEVLRNQPPPSFEHLGSEAAKVLEEAGRSAKVLVEEATDRGRGIVAKAEEDADQIRARAEGDAQTHLDSARKAAEQMLAKANAQRSSIEAEVKRLREYRDGLLGHLGRVQVDLAGFLSEVSDPPPAPHAQPVPSAPSGQSGAAEVTAVLEATDVTEDETAREAATQEAPAAAPGHPAESAIAAARAPK